jgi:hypothetical protein
MAQPGRSESCCCVLHVVTEDGSDCLEVRGPDMQLTCDHITLKVSGQKPVKVSVAGKQVSLSSPSLKAKADAISMSNGEDRLILEGHVRLEYHLDTDDHAEVAAGRVVIDLAGGQLEIKPGVGPNPNHALAPTPAALEQALNFWVGYFR